MKNNPLDRIKLLMSYDSSKTLNENKKELSLINEEDDVDLDEASETGKEIGKLFRNAGKERGEFKGITNAIEKDSKLLQGAGSKLGLTVDEVREAMASERTVQNNIDNAIKKEFTAGSRIGSTGVVGREVEQASKQLALRRVIERGREVGRPLTGNEINAIIKQTEQETAGRVRAFEKDVAAGRVPNPKTGNTRGANKKVGTQNRPTIKSLQADNQKLSQELEQLKLKVDPEKPPKLGGDGIYITDSNGNKIEIKQYYNTGDVNEMNKDWENRGKRETIIDPETGKEVSVVEPKPTPEPPVKNPSKISRLLKSKWLWALGVLGGGVWLFWYLFHSKGKKPPVVSECLTDLVNKNLATIESSNGDPVFVVKQYPGFPQFDSVGGLLFYQTTGVVKTADNGATKTGTWACSGKEVQITWDGEEDTTNTTDSTTGDTTNVTGDTTNVTGDTTTNTTDTTTGDTTNVTGNTTNTTNDDVAAQNARIADMIKTKDNEGKPQETTPEVQSLIDKGKEIYTKLYDNYNADGQPKPFIKSDGNRLKYKGELLPQSDLDALNQYIKSLGYSFLKQKDKRYVPGEKDEKYVWIKERQPQGEPQGQTQEPAQLSEQFIKNIVSKHLRSKL
jgi:hypothetical protein